MKRMVPLGLLAALTGATAWAQIKKRPACRIAGYVTPGARVRLYPAGVGRSTTTIGTSDLDEFTGLEPGYYSVAPKKDGCSFTPVANEVKLQRDQTSINFIGNCRGGPGRKQPADAGGRRNRI